MDDLFDAVLDKYNRNLGIVDKEKDPRKSYKGLTLRLPKLQQGVPLSKVEKYEDYQLPFEIKDQIAITNDPESFMDKAYRRLLFKYHPDKQRKFITSENPEIVEESIERANNVTLKINDAFWYRDDDVGGAIFLESLQEYARHFLINGKESMKEPIDDFCTHWAFMKAVDLIVWKEEMKLLRVSPYSPSTEKVAVLPFIADHPVEHYYTASTGQNIGYGYGLNAIREVRPVIVSLNNSHVKAMSRRRSVEQSCRRSVERSVERQQRQQQGLLIRDRLATEATDTTTTTSSGGPTITTTSTLGAVPSVPVPAEQPSRKRGRESPSPAVAASAEQPSRKRGRVVAASRPTAQPHAVPYAQATQPTAEPSTGTTPVPSGSISQAAFRRGKRERYTLEEKQAKCNQCQKYPGGVGCRHHLSVLQVANRINKVAFGKNIGEKSSGKDCQICISFGEYCLHHLNQRPGYAESSQNRPGDAESSQNPIHHHTHTHFNYNDNSKNITDNSKTTNTTNYNAGMGGTPLFAGQYGYGATPFWFGPQQQQYPHPGYGQGVPAGYPTGNSSRPNPNQRRSTSTYGLIFDDLSDSDNEDAMQS